VLTITIEAIWANTHLKWSKMTVCRVTSRCNHWNFDRNNAYIQPTRRWAQRLQQSTNFTSQSSTGIIITNQVWVHKTKYFQSLVVQRKISESSNDDTRYHDEARTWHHSTLSLLVGDTSHSTDQQRGRVHGQVKLATMSSKVSPENKATSKAEYTNT
jgi:RecA/RadA recombinase